jgi:hypothetical protein
MDKEALFRPRLAEDDVDVPGIGTVRVRALNRAEVMAVQGVAGLEARERKILAAGMVDPALTESEAGQWQKASPGGEIEPVSTRIAELSGLVEGAPKSGVAGDGDEPGAGV